MTGALGVGEDHRLEHVYHLGDVCHLDAVGVTVEHIEREGCHESIAHAVLLIEVTLDGSRFLIPPGSPFIYEQTNLLLRVSLVHDGFVLLDHVFNAEAFAHGPVVVVVAELGSRTLAAFPAGYCIIM